MCWHLAALLQLLEERERGSQVEPDDDMQAWMRERASKDMHGSVASELILRLFGLEVGRWT